MGSKGWGLVARVLMAAVLVAGTVACGWEVSARRGAFADEDCAADSACMAESLAGFTSDAGAVPPSVMNPEPSALTGPPPVEQAAEPAAAQETAEPTPVEQSAEPGPVEETEEPTPEEGNEEAMASPASGTESTSEGPADPVEPEVALPGSISTFPAVSDFAAAGPFATTRESGGGSCTVHRPTILGEGGVLHPILVWGNGTGTSPATYRGVLDHWASHGFIVAAANTSNAGTGQAMLGCLEWVVSQGQTAGSPYEGKVDGERVGASGHSQGGGGSLMAGSDPRVKVTAPLQPYVNGLGHDPSSQAIQTGPMFLMSGSADTIAGPRLNQAPVFERTNVPVFWGILQGANHIITAVGSIGGYRGPATAWFRYHLMDDQSARTLFYDACTLCSDTAWVVESRDID